MTWGSFTGPKAVAACVLFVGATLSGAASADIAAAEALFREGRELLTAGKVAEACVKFAESQRQDPSPGTLLNLASCHAKQGKAASAWAEYLAAKRAAQAAGRADLAEEAQKQADAVAGMRSYLTLSVDKPVPGLKLSRNGEALDTGSFGSKLPVDPGKYVIVASAPGYTDWRGEVAIEGGGDDRKLSVPELKAAPAGQTPKDGAAPGGSAGNSLAIEPRRRSVLPYVVGGVGLAVTGAGLVFGALAKGKYTSATDACPSLKGCSSSAMDERESAETFANVSNVAVGVGLAAVAGGVVLLLVQGRAEEPKSALRVSPSWQPGRAGAFVSGAF